MKVLIAIVANDSARFTEFWSSVLRLKVPVGSVKEVIKGGDWLGARNSLAQRCLDEGFDYLWFMDDDHSFGSDMLEKLLSSALEFDLPVVMPLCTTRRPPFHLVTYGRNPDESNTDPYLPISLEGLPGEGIVEIESGGCAGMLIRRDVLVATESWPDEDGHTKGRWFENTPRSEDIVFCEKAKAAGFKIYADLSCRLGHILVAVVAPKLTPDGWVNSLMIADELQIDIGTAEQLLAENAPPEIEFVEEPEVLPPAVEVVPFTQDPIEGLCNALDQGWRCTNDPGHAGPHISAPIVPIGTPGTINHSWEEPVSDAERIEIWVDDEFVWWWRAIGHDGNILRKDSGINEQTVIGAAHLFYPNVMVHQIQREVDDSRNLRQYGVPGRIWNRG